MSPSRPVRVWPQDYVLPVAQTVILLPASFVTDVKQSLLKTNLSTPEGEDHGCDGGPPQALHGEDPHQVSQKDLDNSEGSGIN
jgi:hypothetical protein